MSFIRPEARAAIWRWREIIIGIAVTTLGLSWVLGPGGLIGWVGWIVIAAGLALIMVGMQRARFRSGSGGPGVVQVDEGQIVYFGPLTGGAVAISDLSRLCLDPTLKPAHWVLEQPGQPSLSIPVNAAGAETLFDVFATLPGLRTEAMLVALSSKAAHPVVIWQSAKARAAIARLPRLPRLH
jgi:hypothetical protein